MFPETLLTLICTFEKSWSCPNNPLHHTTATTESNRTPILSMFPHLLGAAFYHPSERGRVRGFDLPRGPARTRRPLLHFQPHPRSSPFSPFPKTVILSLSAAARRLEAGAGATQELNRSPETTDTLEQTVRQRDRDNRQRPTRKLQTLRLPRRRRHLSEPRRGSGSRPRFRPLLRQLRRGRRFPRRFPHSQPVTKSFR